MNDDIAEIGNIAIYNGKIVEKEDGKFVWKQLYNQLHIYNKYKIEDIMIRKNCRYYLLYFKNNSIWFPEEVFYRNIRQVISVKYGLK